MRKAVFIGATLTALCCPAWADDVKPFGIAAGTPIGELTSRGFAGQLANIGVDAPLPNELFDTYLVDLTPDHRICAVKGVSSTENAVEALLNFRVAQERLAKIYTMEPIRSITVYDIPKHMSEAEAYTEGMIIFSSAGTAPLPSPLSKLDLDTLRSPGPGEIVFSMYVTYQFAGFERCGNPPIDKAAKEAEKYQGL